MISFTEFNRFDSLLENDHLTGTPKAAGTHHECKINVEGKKRNLVDTIK